MSKYISKIWHPRVVPGKWDDGITHRIACKVFLICDNGKITSGFDVCWTLDAQTSYDVMFGKYANAVVKKAALSYMADNVFLTEKEYLRELRNRCDLIRVEILEQLSPWIFELHERMAG